MEKDLGEQREKIRGLEIRLDNSGPGPNCYKDAAEVLGSIYYRVVQRDLQTF